MTTGLLYPGGEAGQGPGQQSSCTHCTPTATGSQQRGTSHPFSAASKQCLAPACIAPSSTAPSQPEHNVDLLLFRHLPHPHWRGSSAFGASQLGGWDLRLRNSLSSLCWLLLQENLVIKNIPKQLLAPPASRDTVTPAQPQLEDAATHAACSGHTAHPCTHASSLLRAIIPGEEAQPGQQG